MPSASPRLGFAKTEGAVPDTFSASDRLEGYSVEIVLIIIGRGPTK
jgi:hypothetical protein